TICFTGLQSSDDDYEQQQYNHAQHLPSLEGLSFFDGGLQRDAAGGDGEFYFDGHCDEIYSETGDYVRGCKIIESTYRQPRADCDRQLPGERLRGHDGGESTGEHVV